MHNAILPDADRGMPRWVAPSHGPETRIGTGDPRAVAQLQAIQRLADSAVCTPRRHYLAQQPRCETDTSGSTTAPVHGRSNPALGEAARTPYREAVDHRFQGAVGRAVRSSASRKQTIRRQWSSSRSARAYGNACRPTHSFDRRARQAGLRHWMILVAADADQSFHTFQTHPSDVARIASTDACTSRQGIPS